MKQQPLWLLLLLLGCATTSLLAQNTKYGTYALFSLTNGFDNSAFGYESLKDNTTGYENSAFGDAALKNNIDGHTNAAFGASALRMNSTGNSNSAFGDRALTNNTTGGVNTGIGAWALKNNTVGSSNTAVGSSALWYNQGGSNNTAVGTWSLAGAYTLNNANNNSALGYWSLSVNRGNDNNAFGYRALAANTTGVSNCSFGSNSLSSNSYGGNNAAFGNNALNNSTTSQNSAFGQNAGYSLTTGTNFCAFGSNAAYNTNTGHNNSAFGLNSLYYNVSGNANTAIGNYALRYGRYSYNVGVGYYAGNDSDLSNECTYLGYNANNDTYLGLYTNSTAIGSGSRMTASNQVTVGNSSVSTIGGFANWTNFSDGRFKKEVSENVPGIDFINKLRPVTYHLDVNGLVDYLHEDVLDQRGDDKGKEVTEATKAARAAKAAQLETGFIAQEVEAAAQSLGYDFSGVDKPQNETDLYGLRYAAFTVPLVKAVQELDAENSMLKDQYAELQQKNTEIQQQNAAILKRLEALEKGLMERNFAPSETINQPDALRQNIPNPFQEETIIGLTVQPTAKAVSLVFSNENGSVVKELNIAERGEISVSLLAKSFSPGVYFYTLMVDGNKVASKKMVIAR